MSTEQVINLPELGEGINEGTVISLQAKEGDRISEGETVLEIETDKAVLGVPSNSSGTLKKWYVKEGDTLKIGDKLLSINVENNQTSQKNDTQKSDKTRNKSKQSTPSKKTVLSSAMGKKIEINFDGLGKDEKGTIISLSVKEGDKVNKDNTLLELETDKAVVPFPSPESGVITNVWVKEGQEVKRGDKGFLLTTSEDTGSVTESQPSPEKSNISSTETPKSVESLNNQSSPSMSMSQSSSEIDYTQVNYSDIPAGPASRKMARELGVDLAKVKGSGRNERISVDDIKAFAKSAIASSMSPGSSIVSKELPSFSQWGKTRNEKTSKLRDTIAQSITYSWQTIPHVHQNDDINIDGILALQKKWKNSFEEKGSTLSVTPFIVKALAQCLKDFPQFNSSYDPARKEIIFKEYFNIGVAVDTPQGLIVPVIKQVDQLSIFDIGARLKTIAAETRERKVKPEDLRGACITLSNLGGIGGAHFNPIINWPEVAILGVGRGKIDSIYYKDKERFYPTMMLPTCLAYDHRVIDGADGARFMVKLKQYLENPDLLLMGMQ